MFVQKNPFSLFLVGIFYFIQISRVEMNFYNLQRKISVFEKIVFIIFLMSKYEQKIILDPKMFVHKY